MSDKFSNTAKSSEIDTYGYDEPFRHWCPDSEAYAPVDALLSYLRRGWQLDSIAGVEAFYYAGYRRVDVFYFTLRRGTEFLEMPVLANPQIDRLIAERRLTLLRVNAIRDEEC